MHFRNLTALEEFQQVVELEKRVWAYTDAGDVVPVPVLAVTVKRGGILIGAFDADRQMAGFVYSFPGMRAGRLTQWSHMLGVLEQYRGQGVGRRLKLEQRQRALEMGVDLIEWTYDPLQAINAHLNFSKLGVVAHEYAENMYGESSSSLHWGTPTDRFVAEWWIRRPRDERGAAAGIGPLQPVNRTRTLGAWLECEAYDLSLAAPRVTVEIPANFGTMQAAEPQLALAWRLATRDIFTSYFRRCYCAVDFDLDRTRGNGRYLLTNRETRT